MTGTGFSGVAVCFVRGDWHVRGMGRIQREALIDSSVFNNVFITMAFPGQLGLFNPRAKLTLRIEANSPVVPFYLYAAQKTSFSCHDLDLLSTPGFTAVPQTSWERKDPGSRGWSCFSRYNVK